MEATVDALLKKGRSQMVRQKTRHRSGNNKPKKIKKIKIQLPKIKLKTPRPKKRRRPRPQKHRRPHRPPPRDSREVVQQSEKPTSAPPGPPPPPPPRSTPSTPSPPTPREKPTEYHLSEPKPTKLFKFELSEAKPTVYPLIANTPVSHGSPTTSTTEFSEISEVPSPNLGGSPAFYFREISDGDDLSSEINGEIFPEELTNSINEFSEVAGSDGKYVVNFIFKKMC